MKQITDEKDHTEPQAVDLGLPSGTLWCDRGSAGGYWSSTWFSAHYARELGFGSVGVDPQIYDPRCIGFAIRPVFQKKSVDELWHRVHITKNRKGENYEDKIY